MRSSALYAMIALTGMVFGAEIVSSHVTKSLVLLLSAYHMLYNVLSLLLLVISHRMSRGKTLKNTFGWARIKVLGLLVNMLFLTALCFAVSVEAVQTMVHALHEDNEPRYPRLIIILGVVDFILNIICFLLIGGYTHHQGCSMIIQGDDVQMNCVLTDTVGELNNRCGENKESATDVPQNAATKKSRWCFGHQFLDVSRDVCSCLTVISTGCVILFMNGLILKYADTILAVALVIVLLSTTYPFVKESCLILLQSIPNHIDVEGLTKRLLSEFPDVLNVHDLHIWRLTTSEIIATVHVILLSPFIYKGLEKPITQFFLKEGISSVTVQPEFTKGTWTEKTKLQCILQCSSNNNCSALTCCGPLKGNSKQSSSARQRLNSSQQNGAPLKNHEHVVTQEEPVRPASNYDFTGLSTVTETTL